MRNVKVALFLIVAMSLASCTQQQRARNFGGEAVVAIEACQKVVNATWKVDNLWILTRPAQAGEKAERFTFKESSSLGVMEGSVTLVENLEKCFPPPKVGG